MICYPAPGIDELWTNYVLKVQQLNQIMLLSKLFYLTRIWKLTNDKKDIIKFPSYYYNVKTKRDNKMITCIFYWTKPAKRRTLEAS